VTVGTPEDPDDWADRVLAAEKVIRRRLKIKANLIFNELSILNLERPLTYHKEPNVLSVL
jgi:hypothetical protein